jgi:hypothetical protein
MENIRLTVVENPINGQRAVHKLAARCFYCVHYE